MTYAELKSKGVKIQESDRYDGDVYLGTTSITSLTTQFICTRV